MICLSCAVTWGAAPDSNCPTCGRPMAPDTPASRDQLVNVLVARRMHALVLDWESRHLLKHNQAQKMVRELATVSPFALPAADEVPAILPPRPVPPRQPAVPFAPPPAQPAASAPAPQPATPQPTKQAEEIKQPTRQAEEIRQPTRQAEEIRQPTRQAEEIRQPTGQPREIEQPRKTADILRPRVSPALEAAREEAAEGVTAGADLFLVEGAGTSGQAEAAGALAALVALDTDSDGESYGSLLVENIGWFIGALLVIAGSVYGVREAWVSLSSVPRHLVVSGALLAYHAGFVGVAAAMAQRSVVAGRVLGGIAVMLLPIVFVSLSALVATAPAAGVLAAALALGVSVLTLRSVAKRFDLAPGLLLRALLPGLVVALPISALEAGSWARTLLPLGALVGVWPLVGTGASVGLLGPALYAALTTEVLALAGAGGMDGLAPLGFTLWASALALVLGERTTQPVTPPRPGLGMIALGLGAASALGAGKVLFSIAGVGALDGPLPSPRVAALASALVTLLYVRSLRAFPRAAHLAAPAAALTATLVMSVVLPRTPAIWPLGASVVASALLLGSRSVHGFAIWGLALGAIGGLAAQGLATSADPPLLPLLSLLPVVLSAHAAARRDRRWLHLAAGVLALGGVTFGALTGSDPSFLGPALLVLSLIYGLAAPLLDEPADKDTPSRLDPLDDLSLLGLGGAALWYLPRVPAGPGPAAAFASVAALLGALRAAWPLLVVGGLLVARARRDHSRLVPLSGFVLAFVAVLQAIGPATLGQHLRLVAELSLLLSLVAAALRSVPSVESTRPRALLGLMDLPWTRGAHRVADALGLASILAVGLGMLEGIVWVSSIVEAQRPDALTGALVLVATAATWFLLPSLAWLKARGSMAALWVAVGVGVEAALVNRLGRPLSPPQVGLRFTVIVALIFGVERLLARYGVRLGARLGNEEAGKSYHTAPRIGVLALGGLLLLDAALIGQGQLGAPFAAAGVLVAVPPTMLLGAALASLLHARPGHDEHWWQDSALLLLLGAGALAGAQHGLTGPAYEQVGAAWRLAGPAAVSALAKGLVFAPLQALVAGNGALIGLLTVAAGLAALSLLSTRTPLRGPLAWLVTGEASDPARSFAAGRFEVWASAGVLLAMGAALWQTSLVGAGLACLTGVLVMAAGSVQIGSGVVGLGLVLGAQAMTATGRIPLWIGPLTAILGVVSLVASSRRREPLFSIQHGVGWLVVGLGLAQAISAGSGSDLSGGVLPLLWSSLDRLGLSTLATWPAAAVLAAAAAGGVVSFRQAGSRSYREYSQIAGGLTPLAAALAASFAWLAARWTGGSGPMSLGAEAPALGLILAATATGTHVTGRKLAAADDLGGLRAARDLLLVGTFVASSWAVTRAMGPAAAGLRAGSLVAGVASLVVVGALSLHAAWREGTSRHAYFVQLAVVGLYGLLRSSVAPFLPPEADAIFALGLGFVLVGVTVLARRAGVPPVANATRIFAALLPIGMAILLRGEPGYTTALGATGAAMLYGTLALVERNRVLGAFGAAAANLALLLAALATGLDGVEIYLAPLGLLLLCLGHLFGESLKSERAALRLVGTLLLYVPAGWSITFQLGRAPDGRYPLAFGAMCLAGIAVGMLLHIRAYLVLGAFFVALDVVANLVHAGLRDHRIGFVVLSVSGLLILGLMVATTLRREEFHALVAKWRRRLSTWE